MTPLTSLGVAFAVPGPAVPWSVAQNPRGGGRIVPHRSAAQAARVLLAWQELDIDRVEKPAGVAIGARFHVCRPQGHYGTGRNDRLLKEWAVDLEPTGRPDLSNLCKLVEDALTGHAYADDDQIVTWTRARKVFVPYWAMPATHVWVGLSEPPQHEVAFDGPAEQLPLEAA